MKMTVSAVTVSNINFAASICGYKPIERVQIRGGQGEKVVLRIYTEPAFLFEFKQELSLDTEEVSVENPYLPLNAEFYRKEVLEAIEAVIRVEVLDPEDQNKVLAFENHPVHLQPYLHWYAEKARETLTAFLQPNDTLVAGVLNRAGELANEADGRMCGYQSWDNTDPLKEAGWIYQALQEEKLHYFCPPQGFENGAGQKVRIPHHLLHDDVRQGTCLDLAVLYASCLEAADLHPVIFVTPGHAFTAVWMKENIAFPCDRGCCTDVELIRKTCKAGYLVPIECTLYTDGLDVPFEDAVLTGKRHIEKDIEYVLDVMQGQRAGYVPAFTYTDVPLCDMDPVTGRETDVAPEAAETIKTEPSDAGLKEEDAGEDNRMSGQDVDMTPSARRLSKLERLKNEAMDFTAKNMLLVHPANNTGLNFPLDAAAFFEGQLDSAAVYMEFKNAQLASGMTEEELEDRLYALEAAAREMQKNNGNGSVYLSVSELKMRMKGQDAPCRTPLYLCPAQIYRNKRGEYVFDARRDAVTLNPVLKAYLLQAEGIDLSDLHADPSENYAGEMERLSYVIGRKEDWQVEKNTAELSLYRVPNEAVWRGLFDEKLQEHEIVKGLLEGRMCWDNEMQTDHTDCDDEDAVFAFEADSSQSRIIRSVNRKRAQVVTGPAGNGKSQTIANIIIDQMRRGRKVLMVAEKPTALHVIEEKLNEAGLAQYCLVLPDKATGRPLSGLREKLAASFSAIAAYQPGRPASMQYEKQYRETAARLHGYEEYMSRPRACGQSLAELLEMYEDYRTAPAKLDGRAAGDAMNGEAAREIILAFEEAKRRNPKADSVYLPYLNLTERPAVKAAKLRLQVLDALQAFEKLSSDAVHFEVELGIDLYRESAKSELEIDWLYAKAITSCPVVGPGFFDPASNIQKTDELEKLTQEMLLSSAGSPRSDRAAELLWEKLDEKTAGSSFAPLEDGELGILKRHLTGTQGFDKTTAAQNDPTAKKETFVKFYRALSAKISDRPADEQKKILTAIQKIARGSGEKYKEAARRMLSQYEYYLTASRLAESDTLKNFDAYALEFPDKTKADLFKEWIKQSELAASPDGRLYQSVCQRAYEAGLGSLIRQMEKKLAAGEMTADDMEKAFEACRLSYNIENIRNSDCLMRDFTYIDYKVYLRQYREGERKIRAELLRTLQDTMMTFMPDIREGIQDSTELGALQKLIRRNDSQLSVRPFFEDAPLAMRQLFPCMLMGPESVAEYIPADGPAFDLVIFDEASQLPTYKALIPISRAYGALFIGDEMQLAPTDFFQKKVLDEEGAGAPIESVLEDAIITSMPQQLLRFHYRSESEELMAFSNHHYYHNEIVTFPDSCGQIADTGITWIPVEDGIYDRGGTRTNRKEAEVVIGLIRDMYFGKDSDRSETLGVITFNQEQMLLVRKLLHPYFAKMDAEGTLENQIDIVNLESCQGREWDHTILSMTYGRDKEGNFSANLGPLSRNSGGRRLNVMITRSRKSLSVVTSMAPEFFDENAAGGNRDLRDFMAYARGDYTFNTCDTGRTEDQTKARAEMAADGRKRNRGILGSLTRRLEEKGYVVHTNIGSSACKVDAGIYLPKENRYVLGILLDDYTSGHYHLRDREVVMPRMLKQKGWKLYRLHAANWYENADHEMKEIEELLKS